MLYYVGTNFMEESGWKTLDSFIDDKAVQAAYNCGSFDLGKDYVGVVEVTVQPDGNATVTYTKKNQVEILVESAAEDFAKQGDDDRADQRLEHYRRL